MRHTKSGNLSIGGCSIMWHLVTVPLGIRCSDVRADAQDLDDAALIPPPGPAEDLPLRQHIVFGRVPRPEPTSRRALSKANPSPVPACGKFIPTRRSW